MSGKKRKKLRVAFQKNRQKRSRSRNLTRELLDDGLDSNRIVSSERISGKGDLSRFRTIISADEQQGDAPLREVDLAKCLSGRVITARGLNCVVRSGDDLQYECTVRGVVRTMARDARNAVVAGDRVLIQSLGDNQGVVERVEPRCGTLSRSSRGREHVIVANVDQILIVASADEPPLKPNLVDRFLISAEKGDVHSVICINKCDLVDAAKLQSVAGLYSRLGYDVVLTSATAMTGLSRLRALLQGQETVLTGQSGVGKSSLLNALEPGFNLRVDRVSHDGGKGRHTTRSARLFEMSFGGWVVDTPGIRQLALWDVIPEEVEGFFVEFRPFVTLCRYPDCTHTHEDGCGVKRAVADDLISPARYASYAKIVADDPA